MGPNTILNYFMPDIRERPNFPGKRTKDISGSVLIEAAITLPLIMVLILGVIQYALIFSAEISIVHAASVASRAAINNSEPDCSEIEEIAEVTLASTLDPSFLSVACEIISGGPLDGAAKVELSYNLNLLFPTVVPAANEEGVYVIIAESVTR